jgi:predicted ABC-type ATPase
MARMENLKDKAEPKQSQAESPTVYVIAGSNGAGKTTFATEFLPDFVNCREFLNADLIAAGLSPFAPETQNIRAGRLLLTRIKELTAAKETFGFETTLSGRGAVRLFKKMRTDGYRVVLFFLWLPSPDMAVARVRTRVRQGGHNVPELVVRRRYGTGLSNFFQLYWPLSHIICLLDGSEFPQKRVAYEKEGRLQVFDLPLFEKIERSAKEKGNER